MVACSCAPNDDVVVVVGLLSLTAQGRRVVVPVVVLEVVNW